MFAACASENGARYKSNLLIFGPGEDGAKLGSAKI